MSHEVVPEIATTRLFVGMRAVWLSVPQMSAQTSELLQGDKFVYRTVTES